MLIPLATALVMVLAVTAAHGLECLNYGEYNRTILEHCDLAGATDLFRVGDLVYVVMVSDGMAIVDISDIDHPQTLAEVTTPGWSSAVAVAGTVAYVADNYSGVAVFDVSDPQAPTFVTGIDTGVTARDVLVDEGVLYVVGSELQIFSLDDPLLPAFLASHDIVGVGYALAKDGDRLYLAGQSGLTVFDVSDPAHPAQLGHRALPHTTECVTVGGDFAYLGGEYESLTVVDVGNPASPVVVATLDLDYGGLGVQLVGTDLYLCLGTGLSRIDVSDPAHPVQTGLNKPPDYAWDVVVLDEQRALVANGYCLLVTDISDMAPIPTPQEFAVPWTKGIATADDYAYLACRGQGLKIIDIGDQMNLRVVGGVATPDTAMDVAVEGDLAVVADQDGGIVFVDVSDRTAPFVAGTYPLPYLAERVTLAGERVYVGAWSPQFTILDASDPAAPVLLSAQDVGTTIFDVAVRWPYAYLATGDRGLLVYDVGDPASPVLAGHLELPGQTACNSIAYESGHLYVLKMGYSSRLYVVDVSSLPSPVLAGVADLPSFSSRVTVHAGIAYVTGSGFGSGTTILDVGNPSAPAFVYNWLAPAYTYDAAVAGDALFVCATQGLSLMRVPCPSPVYVDLPSGGSGPALLAQNAPNPFNPATTIAFSLPQAERVRLSIYNMSGHLVRVLVDELRAAGNYEVQWNGTNARGQQMASGVYVCRMEAGPYREARRMTLLK